MSGHTLKDLLREKSRAQEDMPELDLTPIKKLFSEDEHLPDIDETQVGRIRLHKALRAKFGEGYKSFPHVRDAINHYDKEVRFMRIYKQTLGARNG